MSQSRRSSSTDLPHALHARARARTQTHHAPHVRTHTAVTNKHAHACMHKYARACMHARYSRYTHTQAGGARASAGWEQGWRAGCTRGPLLAAQMQLGSRQPQHGARPRPPSVGACDHLHFIDDGHVHVPVHVHHFYVCIYALQRVIPCFLLLFRCCCC